MSTLAIETLSAADIPSNVQLCHAVGWPDTEAEWRVIHEAAVVLGVRRAGQLVGQGALGLYEGAGSIAKMVIAPDAQRQGIGAAILDGLLHEADSRSLPVVGLVATAFGRPLYESRGFEALGGVCILMGTPHLNEALTVAPRVSDAEQIVALERRFNGCARTAVLSGRLRESNATALLAGGFALATAHEFGARLGPVLADSEATARALTMSICRAVGGPVRVDVPAAQNAFRAWLLDLGLVEKGVNVEMSRGGALPWSTPQRFALATQAWG
jgi:GNAT superfamily N-acetyltransferase